MRTLPDHRDPALDDYGPSLTYYGIDHIVREIKDIRDERPGDDYVIRNLCNRILNLIAYMERTYGRTTTGSKRTD